MNYSYIQPKFVDSQIIRDSNLTQAKPNTLIGIGIMDLTFIDCNLVNCKVPDSATTIGCNNTQVDRCTHLYPEMVERSLLESEPEDCRHRQGTKKQWVKIESGETEFIALKDKQLEPSTQEVRVVKTIDSYGITHQLFEQKVYVYKDIIL